MVAMVAARHVDPFRRRNAEALEVVHLRKAAGRAAGQHMVLVPCETALVWHLINSVSSMVQLNQSYKFSEPNSAKQRVAHDCSPLFSFVRHISI